MGEAARGAPVRTLGKLALGAQLAAGFGPSGPRPRTSNIPDSRAPGIRTEDERYSACRSVGPGRRTDRPSLGVRVRPPSRRERTAWRSALGRSGPSPPSDGRDALLPSRRLGLLTYGAVDGRPRYDGSASNAVLPAARRGDRTGRAGCGRDEDGVRRGRGNRHVEGDRGSWRGDGRRRSGAGRS